jgi:hypothetical protein
MKRMLLLSSFLLNIVVLHAQLIEDFTPNPTGWILSQGAKFDEINANNVIITPGVGGNNPAVIGTPAVNKTSNTVKICLDIRAFTANLNSQVPFPCNSYMDVLFVKSSVTSAGQAADPSNILARIDNYLLPTTGGKTCFAFGFPSSVTAGSFKVFLSFHAACVQPGIKYVIDNISISGIDEVCSGMDCLPTAIDDNFVRPNSSELSFNAVLYGSNINYPAPPAGYVSDATGTDNDQNDPYSNLKWSLVTQPSNGTVVIHEDGTATITRNNLLVTQVSFTYQLCDDGVDNNFATTADNLCASATVTAQFSVGALAPVGLINYSASRNGSFVAIKWTTTSENNNRGFELQRSIGNASYETIAFIPTKAAGGSSGVSINYDYRDNNATNQTSMYRLVQIDNDGTRKMQNIKVVSGESATITINAYPNPSYNGQVSFSFGNSNEKDILITNLHGKAVKVWNGYRNENLSISNLESGVYVLQVNDRLTGERKLEKIMVIKK